MQPEDQLNADVRYTMIPRVLVFLTRGDKILLLRGAPDKKLWANQYNGLGGHVEPDENPYQAATREVYEEAGLHVEDLALRAVIHVTLPQPPGVVLFVFVGDVSTDKILPSDEGIPVWVNRHELYVLPLVEDLPQLLSRILVPGTMTFGHYTFAEDGLHIIFAP